MTRAERAVRAAELRAEGLLYREIGVEMGISRSYAAALLNDPDGSKDRTRKNSYRGVCEMCGGPTCGGAGRAKAPKRCAVCLPGGHEAYWTRGRIIEAIRWWAEEYGVPPSAYDFNPALARRCGGAFRARRGQRHRDERRTPPTSAVAKRFGSWNAAIRAAGYTPVRPGYWRMEVPA